MSLLKYQAKRQFNQTPEPLPEIIHDSQNRFVIQEHQARNLHWDFRLEMESSLGSGEVVLKSWAVPKGLPVIVGEKRLAIEVEDHPVDYVNFSGTIPPGEYGAGTVKIWDQGKFELKKRTAKEIEFILNGKKVNGPYALIKTSFGKNSWLMLKLKK